jgi:hypothetical protein
MKGIFLGVFAANKIPRTIYRPCCFIANTKPDKHPGEHWIAIFINKEGYGDFFCSYGQEPDRAFNSFMERHCFSWNRSCKVLQQSASTTCGQYALFFLHSRANGCSMAEFLRLFTEDHRENDEIVTAFINGLYDQQTTVFDINLLAQNME